MSKKVPEAFLKIFRDSIELLLRRINAPVEEISKVTNQVYERRFNSMFEIIDGYDVQATRKQAREEGREEGRKEAKNEYEARLKNQAEEIAKLQKRIAELETMRI